MKLFEKVAVGLLIIAAVLVLLGPSPVSAKTRDAGTVTAGIAPFKSSYSPGYEIVASAGGAYDIYLSEEIGPMAYYEDLVRGLKALVRDDIVTIHMANFGGYVHSGVQIINAMKVSKATVVVEVEGPSYSMGAVITCAADVVVVHPYTFLMFHHYSGTFSGKGAESREMMDALDVLFENLLTNECVSKGILTPDQAKDIMKGVDVYVHPEDTRK